MKGSYVLLIELPEEREISVGGLGFINFPKGFYAYVGSAMNGLKLRIRRHLRQKKTARWHIDYLLKEAEILEVMLCETEERVECILAQALARGFKSIPGFGSSDCKCSSHLYFAGEEDKLKSGIIEAVRRASLSYRTFSKGEEWKDGIGI